MCPMAPSNDAAAPRGKHRTAVNIWVIDTSSIIAIRRLISNHKQMKPVMTELDAYVHRGAIVFPLQVVGELERLTDEIVRKQGSDPPYAWAKKNDRKATRHGPVYGEAKRVLQRVPNLIDPNKISVGGVDDADPYVIGLALAILAAESHHVVTIITEDFNTSPHKTALADAAGLFRIPTVRCRTFLRDEEIWPPPPPSPPAP
jgi:hypothetical protein